MGEIKTVASGEREKWRERERREREMEGEEGGRERGRREREGEREEKERAWIHSCVSCGCVSNVIDRIAPPPFLLKGVCFLGAPGHHVNGGRRSGEPSGFMCTEHLLEGKVPHARVCV